jgi:putative sarcalumenin
MKNNRLFKILIGLISTIVIVGLVYLGVSYFNGEDNRSRTNSQVIEKKVSKKEESPDKREETEESNAETKQENQGGSKQSISQSKTTTGRTQNVITNSDKGINQSASNNNIIKSQEYAGKKISENEGLGTTGKVFKSQKEAMEFGNSEVARLTKEDRKSRQFSVSKVTADDGSVLGWTVDIYADNSAATNSNDKNESN